MASAPVGKSIIFSLRREAKLVAYQAGQGFTPIEIKPSKRPFTDPNFEPYGIAFDAAKSELWVGDKWNSALWQMELKYTNNRIDLIPKAEFRSELMSQPCAIDFDSQHGILVACFGRTCGSHGGVSVLNNGRWSRLWGGGLGQSVAQACWLPDGGFSFVHYYGSVLCAVPTTTKPPVECSLRDQRTLGRQTGKLPELRLRYVQGLTYSKSQKRIIVSDGSLGAIYEVDYLGGAYRLLAGKPTLTDTSFSSELKPGPSNQWLGRIRAAFEDAFGHLIWLDGSTSRLFKLDLKNPNVFQLHANGFTKRLVGSSGIVAI